MAIINLLFYFTAQRFRTPSFATQVAPWGFVVGAVSMPVCCVVMAHRPGWRALFLIPVSSLLMAGIITLLQTIEP